MLNQHTISIDSFNQLCKLCLHQWYRKYVGQTWYGSNTFTVGIVGLRSTIYIYTAAGGWVVLTVVFYMLYVFIQNLETSHKLFIACTSHNIRCMVEKYSSQPSIMITTQIVYRYKWTTLNIIWVIKSKHQITNRNNGFVLISTTKQHRTILVI